jgi:hypothetical protein
VVAALRPDVADRVAPAREPPVRWAPLRDPLRRVLPPRFPVLFLLVLRLAAI